jgi:hypothetical protein
MPQPKQQTQAELNLGRMHAQHAGLQEVVLKDGSRGWMHPCLKEHPRWEDIAKALGVVEWLIQ